MFYGSLVVCLCSRLANPRLTCCCSGFSLRAVVSSAPPDARPDTILQLNAVSCPFVGVHLCLILVKFVT
eukprot:379895-Hanusia_phi.AAC.8